MPGPLHVTIDDRKTLYTSYMPFVQNGGMFFKTDKPYKLGDEVLVLMRLMEERVGVSGRVVWITPQRAQGKQVRGVGVQFNKEDGGTTQRRIEAELAGSLESDRPTATM